MDKQEKIFATQVELLYQQANTGIFVGIAAATIATVVLWPIGANEFILPWYCAILVVYALRLYLSLSYHRSSTTQDQAEIWSRRFMSGAIAAGTCWGAAGVFFLSFNDVIYQLFVMIPLIIIAGSVPLMSSVPRVYLAFMLPVITPITTWFMLQLTLEQIGFGLQAVIYTLALIAMSNRAHKTVINSLNLRHENDKLIENLSHSQQSLMQAHEQLEHRIEKRTEELTAEIKRRKRIELALFIQKERAEITLHSIGDSVITTDIHEHIRYMNPAAEALTGWAFEEAQGKHYNNVVRLINQDTRKTIDDAVKVTLSKKEITSPLGHNLLITHTQAEIGVELTVAPILGRSKKANGTVIVLHNVDEERKLKHQLAYQAQHDPLTGLKNRRAFEERLALMHTNARKEKAHHALFYIDLDKFKRVNDTCGHIAGDELLVQLTAILQKEIRESDLIARLGGDEFGVLLPLCSTDRANNIATKILAAVEGFHFVWQDKKFTLSASIGIVIITPQSESTVHLMRCADMACYSAKKSGNSIQLYAEKNITSDNPEIDWIARIKHALQTDQFTLFQQPIVPLSNRNTNTTQRSEVLLRMQDGETTLIPPSAFIPTAERHSLMPNIDRWVILNLIDYYNKTWSKAAQKPTLFINLSEASITDESLLKLITKTLHMMGGLAKNIGFEIKETAAIANLTASIHFMNQLKKYGCRFTLDGFGSGFSTFSYLEALPVDYLKIDGSVIKNIAKNPINRAMVEAINTVSHAMGKQTIAECVENDAAYNVLKEIGVDYAQGFNIAPPTALTGS